MSKRTSVDAVTGKSPTPRKLPKKVYEAELFRLQTEFVKLQEWVRHTGARIVIVFEGRDAAGHAWTYTLGISDPGTPRCSNQ